ncbi:hypothetical protein [Actinoplanes flavus]|uniref:Uncharacterized protein n=1 Tax=Actinoplanes flavus TaxID=2820290 RepID=A0ABS3UGE0_9ACTN|nr:hypothetical protein [Actinoplanes flavus]MBO3737845.1 hypothetical protein [Actinoplanes flavus]
MRELSEFGLDAVTRARDGLTTGTPRPANTPDAQVPSARGPTILFSWLWGLFERVPNSPHSQPDSHPSGAARGTGG